MPARWSQALNPVITAIFVETERNAWEKEQWHVWEEAIDGLGFGTGKNEKEYTYFSGVQQENSREKPNYLIGGIKEGRDSCFCVIKEVFWYRFPIRRERLRRVLLEFAYVKQRHRRWCVC